MNKQENKKTGRSKEYSLIKNTWIAHAEKLFHTYSMKGTMLLSAEIHLTYAKIILELRDKN